MKDGGNGSILAAMGRPSLVRPSYYCVAAGKLRDMLVTGARQVDVASPNPEGKNLREVGRPSSTPPIARPGREAGWRATRPG